MCKATKISYPPTVHCLNPLCFPLCAGEGLSNFQAEILRSLCILPNSLPPQKTKNENKTPLSVPITPSLGEEAFLGGWTRVGGGETVVLVQGDSRVLQGSSQKEVRESGQKTSVKMYNSPKLENHSWLYSTNNSKGNSEGSFFYLVYHYM